MPSSSSSASEPRRAGAESSRKLLSALLAFDIERPHWTVPDLATHVGVPASTMYRYVALLRETGLIEAAGGGRYRLGERITGLARAVDATRGQLVDLAHPHLVDVRDAIDETVLLCRRGGQSAYCVDRVESRHPVRLQFDPGQAMTLHYGSLARVLLASMPVAERESYLDRFREEISEEHALRLNEDSLDDVRRAGWTESFEEVDEGIWGTAAAITAGGDVVASIGTAAPLYRFDEAHRADAIARIRAAAAAISAELG